MKQFNKDKNNKCKCGHCGHEDSQINMVKVSKKVSDNRWLCQNCYEDIKYDEYGNNYKKTYN